MNVKNIAKLMDKKKVYRWGMNAFGNYILFGKTGKTIVITDSRYAAEVMTKKLRGMNLNIVGDIPYEGIKE